MERLLTLKLDVLGCEAEALLNGVPLARANAARPRALVPVHEYTLPGANRLELVIWPAPAVAPEGERPPPLKLKADGSTRASVRILLPRIGNSVDESSARSLIQIEWALPAGETYEAPLRLQHDGNLPVNFPRWRWVDAPLATPTPALREQVLALLLGFQADLSAGNTAAFLGAVRFRAEELAIAYQQPMDVLLDRLRDHLEQLHQSGRLKWIELTPETLALRRLAGGRLLECLTANGEAALRTEPDEHGRACAFPLRLAAAENKLYVLR
jgi:hypothetical protein